MLSSLKRIPTLAVLLPWVVIIIVALLAYHLVNLVDQNTFKNVGDTSREYLSSSGLNECIAQIPDDTPVTAGQFENCLQSSRSTAEVFDENVKPRVEELKWLLTIIGAIASAFVVAQSFASWYAADVYKERNDKALADISAAQEAINARYPLFEQIEKTRREAIEALNKEFFRASKAPDAWAGNTEALDWHDNLFRRLSVEDRHKLLSVEGFASIAFDPALSSAELAEILRKFSLFYRAKFLYEDDVVGGAFEDLERAESYLISASKKKADFTIENDLGSLYGTISKAVKKRHPKDNADAAYYLGKSQDAFCESLKTEPKQQRAHYSLAVILGHHRKLYADAVAELELGLKQDVWQRERSDYMQTIMFYNMACYQSQLLQDKTTSTLHLADANSVIEPLEKAAGLSYVQKEIIEKDFDKDEGDFIGLCKMAAPDLKARLGELRATLEANTRRAMSSEQIPTSPASRSLRKAFVEAARLIKDALAGKNN